MNSIVLRPYADGDLAALATLISELGYPTAPEQMAKRMGRIVSDADYATFIAEQNGVIVGMVGVTAGPTYEHDTPIGWIMALVVSPAARRRGVGARLLAEAEGWAHGRGSRQIALTAHLRRTDAHAFYTRLGYEETGKRFVKRLPD